MRKSWEKYKKVQREIYGEASEKERELERIIDIMTYSEALTHEAIGLALKEHDAEDSIMKILSYIGMSTDSDRAYVFECRDGYVTNTYEWCGENVTAQKENLSHVPFEDVDMWLKTFERGDNVIISDVELIKEKEPVIYSYLVPQNIHSLVVSPLVADGKIMGFYGVDNPPGELMDYIYDMAWVVSYFITAMLIKKDLVEHLEKLSYYDQLTGLRNRHALFDTIKNGRITKNVGVIYCDVMGLKKVNDMYGHVAGDELLLRAADCIKAHFRISDSYRLGGDEFLVMCGNIDEADFYARVEKLRIKMKENNAMMALGCIWNSEIEDADKEIARADELMYKEKQEYYKNNPR